MTILMELCVPLMSTPVFRENETKVFSLFLKIRYDLWAHGCNKHFCVIRVDLGNDSWCSRILLMNVAFGFAHCVCKRIVSCNNYNILTSLKGLRHDLRGRKKKRAKEQFIYLETLTKCWNLCIPCVKTLASKQSLPHGSTKRPPHEMIVYIALEFKFVTLLKLLGHVCSQTMLFP